MNKSQKTIIIDSSAVSAIIKLIGLNKVMDDLIEELQVALINYEDQETVIPARNGFNYSTPHLGLVEWMPLMRKDKEVIIKIVGYHPENPIVYKIPTILSTISCYDAHTGHLNYLIDGVLLTALRTGASSAVASRMMAKSDSKVLGVIGCGAQSVTQIHALSRLFDISQILVYDTDFNSMESLNSRLAPINLKCQSESSDITTILQESDIVCTATSISPGEGPLFENLATKPHLHINAVGADFPGKYEIPKSLLEDSFVCPDFLTQALKEGECQQLEMEDIGPSWVQLSKNLELQSEIKSSMSVFDSTGWALEDQVVADLFARYAAELNLGKKMDIESFSDDEKNPYGTIQNMTRVLS